MQHGRSIHIDSTAKNMAYRLVLDICVGYPVCYHSWTKRNPRRGFVQDTPGDRIDVCGSLDHFFSLKTPVFCE